KDVVFDAAIIDDALDPALKQHLPRKIALKHAASKYYANRYLDHVVEAIHRPCDEMRTKAMSNQINAVPLIAPNNVCEEVSKAPSHEPRNKREYEGDGGKLTLFVVDAPQFAIRASVGKKLFEPFLPGSESTNAMDRNDQLLHWRAPKG